MSRRTISIASFCSGPAAYTIVQGGGRRCEVFGASPARTCDACAPSLILWAWPAVQAVGGTVETEERFAGQLRAFDHEAWSDLFDQHRDNIWRYVLARSGSSDVADDVTAQVFVEALESIERYRYRGKPILAWLYRIARNQASKQLRSSRRQVALLADPPSDHGLDRRLDALALAEALRTLTPGQADVIALRFLAGYSTREIARAIGKSPPAVYSLEVRAMARLRRYFGIQEGSATDEIWAAQGIGS